MLAACDACSTTELIWPNPRPNSISRSARESRLVARRLVSSLPLSVSTVALCLLNTVIRGFCARRCRSCWQLSLLARRGSKPKLPKVQRHFWPSSALRNERRREWIQQRCIKTLLLLQPASMQLKLLHRRIVTSMPRSIPETPVNSPRQPLRQESQHRRR